jgi:hypothetical protein
MDLDLRHQPKYVQAHMTFNVRGAFKIKLKKANKKCNQQWMPGEKKKITLLTVTLLFLFALINFILDAPRTVPTQWHINLYVKYPKTSL